MMRNNMRCTFLLIFAMGCSPAFNSSGVFETEKQYNDENDQYNDFFSQAGLPDLRDQMDAHYCDDERPGASGASSYFLGTYLLEDDEFWIGKERWYLFPTPNWIEVEDEITAEGCYVTWDLEANEGECINCDLTLSVVAGVNRTETNCPEGLWDNPEEEAWEATYDVDISDGETTFSFNGSGTFIGQGYASSSALSFLSEVSCAWF